jgi:hypothetical protein
MAESKIICPKCGGHVAFPKEIAGQAATCPHCQEPIILGAKPRTLLWAIVGVGFVCAVVGSAVVFWHMGKVKTDHALRPSSETTKAFEKKESATVGQVAVSEDDKAIETLCRAMYERANEKDFDSMYQIIAAPCKGALTATEIGDAFTSGGLSYRFVAMESITYPAGPSGKFARARFSRVIQDVTGENEGVREFKCVKERDGWKLFRDGEWMEKIIADFGQSGFSEGVRSNVQNFCSSDPFDKWPVNETNAFEQMYESVHPGVKEVFPWNLSFSVTTNYIDGYLLMIGFSIRNGAGHAWENADLSLELKHGGKVVCEADTLLSSVGAGTEVSREASFFLKQPLQESTRYELDVVYTLAEGEKCFLAASVPVEFKVQKLTELVKFEVVKKSFDITKSDSGEDMLAARVDYRVTNVGREPLKTVELKFVWSSLSGEVLDQTTEYAVGYGDLPLASQQKKSSFVHCGKGYTLRRVPVKVDIYLEDGERHWPLYKALLVQ